MGAARENMNIIDPYDAEFLSLLNKLDELIQARPENTVSAVATWVHHVLGRKQINDALDAIEAMEAEDEAGVTGLGGEA